MNNSYLYIEENAEKKDISYIFQKSRNGEIVPSYTDAGGNLISLHSMIDPLREAKRLVSSIPDSAGFIIFLGLGGGFLPKAALELTDKKVAVIDFDSFSIKQLLANADYSDIFNNSRFTFLANPPLNVIKNFILQNYNPAICGDINIIPLRSRTNISAGSIEEFNNAAAAIEDAINCVADDYSVQSRFGKCWFSNIIRNIKITSGNFHSLKIPQNAKKAAIIAAGPSLNTQIESVAMRKNQNYFIISCDTALPVLFQNGIDPDAVVSIDCQHISYHHFLGSYHKLKSLDIPLILDIAGPPLLAEFSSRPVFFSSAHPLALYISHNYYPFKYFDTSGGNVTYACLSLAELIGFEEIEVFGADFSYIGSETYARGSYIHEIFNKKQNRLSPLESLYSSFLYRSNFLPPVKNGQKYLETSSLRSYRIRFEEKASSIQAEIKIAKGFGAPVNIKKNKSAKINSYFSEIFDVNSKLSGIDFLRQYRSDINALQIKEVNHSNKKVNQIFTTLLPYAAFLKHRNSALKTIDLLEEVKKQCIAEIDKLL